ncbi:hypothetical protein C1T17_13180 [Sphingobium sp. SCG-1]|uniref:hypothetical protein n=1 Tax=Sphingobium sp. SCG-1 TaxID=2072936 RepID=UPI000CD69ADE|nr:hypothetical protein [Sphingobium sp. SCG-1]AUW58901.1 hypothetical protein C1T17_13180 [Sphingobium sp. SCG-1]
MTQPSAGRIFHEALRACLSEGRAPHAQEVEHIARKIWSDAFARKAGTDWEDVPEQSDCRLYVVRAARMALGVL